MWIHASRMSRPFLPALLALGLVAMPACAQEKPGTDGGDGARIRRMLVGSGGGERWRTDFSRISVPPEEIVSGGPPKDGIPSIDRPRFESAEEAATWLDAREPVVVVERKETVRAYPLRILIWHEIVNDEVAGEPLVITYCPLCNTALVFRRRVGDRILDFGTTGRLRHSDLVMYDRQTESWWQQASGEAIVGELTGTTLELYPANTLAWGMARQLYPEIQVLSRQTGFRRRYGINPYEAYDSRGSPYAHFFDGRPDPRLPAMERIAGVNLGDGWAVPFSVLERERIVNAEVEGTPFVVVWAPGASSALDRSEIPKGRDVGQTAVFDRRLNGRTLTMEWTGETTFRDAETGSTWDLAGRALSGPLAGQRLTPIPHGNHFWFAWAAFRPGTSIWDGS